MSDIEFDYDEEDDFEYEDCAWAEPPEDTAADIAAMSSIADPVYIDELKFDAYDSDDYDYETDYYYDSEEECKTPSRTKRRKLSRGKGRVLITATKNEPRHTIKGAVSQPILYANVAPALLCGARAEYAYQHGQGEKVALLKDWRQIFNDTRPLSSRTLKRTNRAGEDDSLSARFSQLQTGSKHKHSRRKPGDSKLRTKEKELLDTLQSELEPLELELRPTSPPPHSIYHPPSNISASSWSTGHTNLPAPSPSPPASSIGGIGPQQEGLGTRVEKEKLEALQSRKRKSDEMEVDDTVQEQASGERPTRRQKKETESATPVRRSERNKRRHESK
ncbi:hypothetical protein KEM55_000552 [Ascosphaera atra]|nr:hypothetical protein KEM55_000552 [Ascosphaera atra]